MIRLSVLLFTLLAFSSCGEDKSANIYSYTIESKKSKLDLLKEYLTTESGLIDGEYHIWIKDNTSGLVPGPSDHSITLALKIIPDSIGNWTTHLVKRADVVSTRNWDELKLKKEEWDLSGVPEVYYNDSKTEIKLVYREKGILLAAYSSMSINLE